MTMTSSSSEEALEEWAQVEEPHSTARKSVLLKALECSEAPA